MSQNNGRINQEDILAQLSRLEELKKAQILEVTRQRAELEAELEEISRRMQDERNKPYQFSGDYVKVHKDGDEWRIRACKEYGDNAIIIHGNLGYMNKVAERIEDLVITAVVRALDSSE